MSYRSTRAKQNNVSLQLKARVNPKTHLVSSVTLHRIDLFLMKYRDKIYLKERGYFWIILTP